MNHSNLLVLKLWTEVNIFFQSGEEIPPPMIPSGSESPSRESVNSYLPTRKRKKKRKSSVSSGKWPRTSSSVDDENRPIGRHIDNDRVSNYLQKDDDSANQGDDLGEKFILTNVSFVLSLR